MAVILFEEMTSLVVLIKRCPRDRAELDDALAESIIGILRQLPGHGTRCRQPVADRAVEIGKTAIAARRAGQVIEDIIAEGLGIRSYNPVRDPRDVVTRVMA